MKNLTMTLAIAAAALCAAPVAAQSGKSLAKCEKALAKETTKLAGGIQKAVSKCLDKVASEVLAKGDPVADAAKVCASSLRKLENSEAPDKTLAAKFAAKSAKVCDPADPNTKADHSAAEALDPNDAAGLQAGLLGVFCSEFGGDGSLDDVGEWIDCAAEAAYCSALQQVAVEYPRAPEWLGQILTALVGGSDPKFVDAAATASALLARLDADADGVADIACGQVMCGNGVVDAGEECDQSDLDGASCVGEGFAGGTLACGAGCVLDSGGCYGVRFVDNGDGTITDNATALMWEKKASLDFTEDPADLHDVDNTYNWAGTCSNNAFKQCQPNAAVSAACFAGVEGDSRGCDLCGGGEGFCSVGGPGITVWEWLSDLNASNFAGHSDWRLARKAELESILNLVYAETTDAAIDAAFRTALCGFCEDITDPACSCFRAPYNWTGSTYGSATANAWTVNMSAGEVTIFLKTDDHFVRAVRGGS